MATWRRSFFPRSNTGTTDPRRNPAAATVGDSIAVVAAATVAARCTTVAAGLSRTNQTNDPSVRDSGLSLARNASLGIANGPRIHGRAYTIAINAISHSWCH